MRPPDDKELDLQLRDALRRESGDLVFTRAMQDKVLTTIAQREQGNQRGKRSFKERLARRSRAWAVGLSSAAAGLLLVAWGVASWQQAQTAHRAPGTQLTMSATSAASHAGSVMYGGLMQQAPTAIPASLAPVESQDLTLTPGMSRQAQQQQSGATTTQVGGGTQTANGQASATGGTGAGVSTPPAAPFVQLARQEFTVSTRLYNTSDQPLAGASLQGMLFILRQPAGLSPDVEADWEYFVDGPKAVIPPHQSVLWTFTPNPAPPYKTLSDRVAHMIWMFRSPHPAYPTLYLGTLPVRVTQVHLQITGSTHTAVVTQFIRVTARLTNQGSSDWDERSALGMLFFQTNPGASLLSRGTYKYFDDITPVGQASTVLRPGQSGEVQFIITGVPGTDMRQLPLTILLVARNQIGA